MRHGEERPQTASRVDELTLRAALVARHMLLSCRRQVHQRPGELPGLGVGCGLRRAPEVRDGLQVLALAQVRLAVEQGTPVEV